MVETELLRACLLEALRRDPNTHYDTLETATACVALERGLPAHGGHQPHLLEADMRRFRETVWSLIIEGVLAPGKNANNMNWPWLSVTEYGATVISDDPTPYDPDGYLEALSTVHQLDEVEAQYVAQALQTLRHNLPDACAVMLGAAAEHLLLALADAVRLADPTVSGNIQKCMRVSASRTLTYLHGYFSQLASLLPRDLKDTRETNFAGIAGQALPCTSSLVISLSIFTSMTQWASSPSTAMKSGLYSRAPIQSMGRSPIWRRTHDVISAASSRMLATSRSVAESNQS